jgi:hypothetical protein
MLERNTNNFLRYQALTAMAVLVNVFCFDKLN